MAKKTATPVRKVGLKKAKWAGFVNVYLSPEDKKAIKANLPSSDSIVKFIELMGMKGYKFSVSHSLRGDFYTATLYGQYEEGSNAGYAMSLKHSDLSTAIAALMHCQEMAGMDGDWSDRFTTSGGNDW